VRNISLEVDVQMPSEADVDAHLSLAQRRPRRQAQIPKRYQDDLPQASTALPPPSYAVRPRKEIDEGASSTTGSILSVDKESGNKGRPILCSPPNIFGLSHCYYSTEFPLHDPEEFNDFNALSDVCRPSHEADVGPYPNCSSFTLGEWYWGDGVQKTKKNFKNLIDIITGPDFHPEDVRDTKWDSIDCELGGDEATWEDENILAPGWKQMSVTIQVPFHRFTASPGLQDYVIHDFRHRSIVSILKEKLVDDHEFRHFHFEPYELKWQSGDFAPEDPSIRVHGELYTSPAFLKAHTELQASQGEPGCNLPHVLVGLMFASDQTHLTSFGETKLWPVYLFFGNDSKYRHGKPSLHLCNHVAYFHKVRLIVVHWWIMISFPTLFQLLDEFKDFVTS
jgi:Plavaka transposase